MTKPGDNLGSERLISCQYRVILGFENHSQQIQPAENSGSRKSVCLPMISLVRQCRSKFFCGQIEGRNHLLLKGFNGLYIATVVRWAFLHMIMFDVVVKPIKFIMLDTKSPAFIGYTIAYHVFQDVQCDPHDWWEIGSLWTSLPDGNLGIPKTMGVNTRMV